MVANIDVCPDIRSSSDEQDEVLTPLPSGEDRDCSLPSEKLEHTGNTSPDLTFTFSHLSDALIQSDLH